MSRGSSQSPMIEPHVLSAIIDAGDESTISCSCGWGKLVPIGMKASLSKCGAGHLGGLKPKMKKRKRKSCTWTEDDDSGMWATDCGNYFKINDGQPSTNKMTFCCYCGKPLVEGKTSTHSDDECHSTRLTAAQSLWGDDVTAFPEEESE